MVEQKHFMEVFYRRLKGRERGCEKCGCLGMRVFGAAIPRKALIIRTQGREGMSKTGEGHIKAVSRQKLFLKL